jgi:hypothetical protein
VSVTTPASGDVTPPSAATGLWGETSPNCGFADFQWTSAADPVDGWSLDYEIYEDGALLDVWTGEVVETDFGRHTYTVKAVDRAGNSSAASNATVLDFGMRC